MISVLKNDSLSPIHDQRKNLISRSNTYILDAKFTSLTIPEQRLLLFCLSKINPFLDELPRIEFTITDYTHIVGLNYYGNYTEIKDTISGLKSRVFWIKNDSCDILCSWIAKAIIDKKGNITIELDNDLRPFFLHLRKDFTSTDLQSFLLFRSKYSARLFSVLRAKKYKNLEKSFEYIVPVDKLRELMGVIEYENKHGKSIPINLDSPYVKRYTNFKQRCLLPALEEVNRYTDLDVTMDERKQGRTVTDVVFTISQKDPVTLLQMWKDTNILLDIAAGLIPGQTVLDLD